MFKRIKELLRVEETLRRKQGELTALEQKTADLQALYDNTVQDARLSLQGERDEVLEAAKREGDTALADAKQQADTIIREAQHKAETLLSQHGELVRVHEELERAVEKTAKELKKLEKDANKWKTEAVGIKTLLVRFPEAVNYSLIEKELAVLEESLGDGVLGLLTELHLHHKDSKQLKKDMTANQKELKKLLETYETRYTTKANKAIYQLMVIALQAELQNLLYTLNYTNVDKAVEQAKALIAKYTAICAAGNASILPTVTRFLTELEPLFLNAVQIEYSYYVQKELEKEEQRRIREQIRQEQEEQRILEQERKKIEKEEEKYLNEIQKNEELLRNESDSSKVAALEAKLAELNRQVQQLESKKEEIVKRANGKAGYVYVISNLGSFGEQMFKVGMTRRLNPQDRVDELGDASVPFKFDVHAMIFSEDAVGLEQKLHEILEDRRVNKINLRKEFFAIDVEELQQVVQDIDPAVEFTTTMMAGEYRQSLSLIQIA
ncbi:GIY-YIG nuclease family protein [Ectobacillus ponti]|uniref:GIY-YIG nuclease family protein n=1 Tax=Ectobacillus ponti TaxID=2961894 RepID=A0AA41XBH2_9BACI|nr:GIY-YIG nuclease family protein [Ectobacillus ponti]MCP8970415.1 GIY-YIG nuclease family protein [Ectobacillus ponti]